MCPYFALPAHIAPPAYAEYLVFNPSGSRPLLCLISYCLAVDLSKILLKSSSKVFAVGAVAAAGVLGGVLYGLYPDRFTPGYASENGAASTASSTYDGSDAQPTTNTASQDESTASQAPDDGSTGGMSSGPQPSPDPGY